MAQVKQQKRGYSLILQSLKINMLRDEVEPLNSDFPGSSQKNNHIAIDTLACKN